jgi:S-adenosylmethionine synthetase
MARYIAKNLVAAKLAQRCEVQLAYALGVAEPVSIMVETFGTSQLDNQDLVKMVRTVFPLKPAGLIKHLRLMRPIYQATAAYGHFGRNEETFTWEKIDQVDRLKELAAG